LSVGLLALLDDIAALVKMSAASLDDIAGMATKAGIKAGGAVIDDTAITPRFVGGFSPQRELPMVAKIARGSIRNKLVFLLPVALLLSAFLPAVIMPLLMIGGAYLCYEGAEKVIHAVTGRGEDKDESAEPEPTDPRVLEDTRVASAIRTDFILSAEIMTIALAAIPVDNILIEALVLALVAVGITAAVYGTVALIVKADDIGLYLARFEGNGWSTRLSRAFGRGLVRAMPRVMTGLSVIGTAAMIWVGGGIVVHGLDTLGMDAPAHLAHAGGALLAQALPVITGAALWIGEAVVFGLFGLILGALLVPLANYAIEPLWHLVRPGRSD